MRECVLPSAQWHHHPGHHKHTAHVVYTNLGRWLGLCLYQSAAKPKVVCSEVTLVVGGFSWQWIWPLISFSISIV